MKLARTATILVVLLLTASQPVLAAGENADASALPATRTAPEDDGYFARTGELVLHALSLIGVNYKFGGNAPDGGFDCSGLVNYVFHEAGGPQLPHNSRAMSNVGEKIQPNDLHPGDLVFFNTLKRSFSHVGIYIGEERFVHAPSRGGEIEVANMNDRYWRKRYNGARRIPF